METSQIVTIKNENKLPMPSITIVPETGILVNYPVQFIANGEDEDGNITKYSWDIDGQTYNTKIVNHVFSEQNEHTITLKITDDDEGENQVSKNIKVNVIPHQDTIILLLSVLGGLAAVFTFIKNARSRREKQIK